ncbi:polysaccharide deacetylase family protein [Curtobacterium sp. 9128]|uniref:polysaccharide deacetylase family protein n=1 Tax=Curtobacterium sp. 9128 TaxID=1793722 RepID=UPI00248200D5|nr:polysaccharide deacetylase family protein [Curtobacterium sp. 9128]
MNHRAPSRPSRRALLAGVGGTVLTGALAACSAGPSSRPTGSPTSPASASPSPSASSSATATATATATVPPVALQRQPLPAGTITGLPEGTPGIAWTVDDGASSEVVEAYARFAAETGTRLTFFVNGVRPAWTEHADLLRPLVTSGQVQLGNHTWDHPALTKLSDQGIIDQLTRNHDFIQDTYGVDAKPYFRPPFGYHDARVDAAAARAGYTTPLLWYGSLADSGDITSDQIVGFAEQWFQPAHIVIGHANFRGTIGALPRLHALLQERKLSTFTLDDVFER